MSRSEGGNVLWRERSTQSQKDTNRQPTNSRKLPQNIHIIRTVCGHLFFHGRLPCANTGLHHSLKGVSSPVLGSPSNETKLALAPTPSETLGPGLSSFWAPHESCYRLQCSVSFSSNQTKRALAPTTARLGPGLLI